MRRLLKSRAGKAGLPPGTAVHIGERRAASTRIHVLHYDAAGFTERELTRVDDCTGLQAERGVTWVHVTGVHDTALLERLGGCFGLHPLVLEDISNTDQRTKLEDYEGYSYLVLKTLQDGADARETAVDDSRDGGGRAASGTAAEQVSLVLGPDFVLSFEESEPTAFAALRARLREGRGAIRAQGADYLVYSLLDSVVDGYFLVLERFGARIEALHEELLGRAGRRAEGALHALRREMVLLRKSLWPLREVIGGLERGSSRQFRPETWVYLRDVYDHVIHLIDTLESFHEILTGMLDIYLLNATNRLNEVIKVLTIIATAFSPPMLIASLYGMNFRFMPELAWPWGYPLAVGLMILSGAAMLVFFRYKKWI